MSRPILLPPTRIVGGDLFFKKESRPSASGRHVNLGASAEQIVPPGIPLSLLGKLGMRRSGHEAVMQARD
jgi:hypothetical protein